MKPQVGQSLDLQEIGKVWKCPHFLQEYLTNPLLISLQSKNLSTENLINSRCSCATKDLIKLKICVRLVKSNISLIIRSSSFLYFFSQLNFTEKESRLQKIFFKSAIGLLQRLSHSIGLADAFIYGCPTLKMYQIEPAVLLQSDKCEQYGVPFDAYPLQSMIGKIQNTHQVELSLAQKAQLKYNRISTQIALGISTLKALMLGKKRFIDVQADRFNKFI